MVGSIVEVDVSPFILETVDGSIPQSVEDARTIIEEFRQWMISTMNVDFAQFQSYAEEMASLPGKYSAEKGGILYIVREAPPAPSGDGATEGHKDGEDAAPKLGRCVGVLALRHLTDDAGEVKRMFVSPIARGHRLGQKLTQLIINEAIRIGYKALYLDTLERLTSAIRVYEDCGFVRCEPYCHNPTSDVLYYRLDLPAGAAAAGAAAAGDTAAAAEPISTAADAAIDVASATA